ncbi:efflux RND transporter periplasmic adaptor subunit [Sinimarinibacterium sp. CAU 1509]|uniref:efflux RND transporter periplasmic adaptor subunit n=1 Tax=Sinimarinibacterium sp. CAU 1509 TaxID=2562283 RepID=UPI0010AB8168|nr:efflux RND transporter periplasmic adaptor subunit [Sinimarinibacterium sp. CAU 1509]TJY62254.1 efflux RND transporter periplasmic adaptor subunit [Sinimarinibacterium sp. CAU 1509]
MTMDGRARPEDIAATLGIGKTAPHDRRWRRWLLWLLLVGVLLAIGAIAWSTLRSPEVSPYTMAKIRRGDLTVTVAATGTLAPTHTVDVGIEVSGTVATVEVDYNDHVKVGQILARLDPSKLEAQVRQSEAGLTAAKANVLQARASQREADTDLRRLHALREAAGDAYVSQQAVDAAQAASDRAQANLASAAATVQQTDAALNAIRTELAKAVIRSPIDGVVLQRAVDPGQTVAASFQSPVLFVLAEDLTQMQMEADIDEADVGQVREGQQATFTVDAYPDRSFPARITQLRYGSETVEGVVTYKAILDVDNSDLALRPGMTATVTVVTQQVSDALLVPNAALRFAPAAQATAGSSRGLVGGLIPRPPQASTTPTTPDDSGPRRVWVLRDGVPAAVSVQIGASDGVDSVLLNDALPADAEVITETAATP